MTTTYHYLLLLALAWHYSTCAGQKVTVEPPKLQPRFDNNILFVRVGKTASLTGYAFIVNTFNLTTLYARFDHVFDQVTAYLQVKYNPYTSRMMAGENETVALFNLVTKQYKQLRALARLFSPNTHQILDHLQDHNGYQKLVQNITRKRR